MNASEVGLYQNREEHSWKILWLQIFILINSWYYSRNVEEWQILTFRSIRGVLFWQLRHRLLSCRSPSKQTHGVCKNSTESENKIIWLRARTALGPVAVLLHVKCEAATLLWQLLLNYWETHDRICTAGCVYISRFSIAIIWTLRRILCPEKDKVMEHWRKVHKKTIPITGREGGEGPKGCETSRLPHFL
jgi:hypothetical protein